MIIGTRISDERGLVGKIALVWVLVLALFVVAAVDAGSIAVTRFRVGNAADRAAFVAAGAYEETQDRSKALEAAEDVVGSDVPNARIPEGGFEIDPRTGDATVKVVAKAWSLVAGRWSYTRPYTKVSATSTSEPPTL